MPKRIQSKRLRQDVEWQFLVAYDCGVRIWHGRDGTMIAAHDGDENEAQGQHAPTIEPATMELLVTEFNMLPKAKLQTIRFGAQGLAFSIVTTLRRASTRASLASSGTPRKSTLACVAEQAVEGHVAQHAPASDRARR